MPVLMNESFAQGLAAELAGKMVDMSGAAFDDYDFAMFLARNTKGAKIVWTEDGVGVACQDALLKTIVRKIRCPHEVRHVEQTYCISDATILSIGDENVLGAMVLGIWNARITDVRKKFATTRTVVLIKGDDLSTVSVFEEEALKFLPEDYEWEWNQKGNLEGYVKGTDVKKFTWQPHGSQFTITKQVNLFYGSGAEVCRAGGLQWERLRAAGGISARRGCASPISSTRWFSTRRRRAR